MAKGIKSQLKCLFTKERIPSSSTLIVCSPIVPSPKWNWILHSGVEQTGIDSCIAKIAFVGSGKSARSEFAELSAAAGKEDDRFGGPICACYMELPEGFEEPGYVCRLRRSLYGLKQAPRIWYQCVHRVLASHGFTMAQSDNCVFYKPDCVVCVYVDDFLIAAANTHEIEQVQRALQAEFRLNDLGTPRSFLGIQFDYHVDGSVSIHQHQYIQKVLSDFGMEGCQPKSTPMDPKQSLNHRPDEELPDEEAKARFATAIGSFMYLMPQSHHQVALQRLLRYIKATQSHRITYRSGQLIGYTDADFGGSVVTDGAYSTSGYVFQLAGAPVSWSSKRQGPQNLAEATI
ncbi:hypothetical protein DTO027I6_9902 [Penicillium roqueforti]|nr:hypothetical protein CBS147337_9990 [Penicillium roqueforti]KAI3184987.1 hypothetical protein DTO027I6_9902 [Penicillium roqueforti]